MFVSDGLFVAYMWKGDLRGDSPQKISTDSLLAPVFDSWTSGTLYSP